MLVGHSMGGYVGAMVSLAGDAFRVRGSCRSTLPMRASLPEGFVSVAGVSLIHHDYRIDQEFFGGTYAQIPGVWKRGSITSATWAATATSRWASSSSVMTRT